MYCNIKLLALLNFFMDFKLYGGILILYFVRITGSYGLAMTLFSIVSLSNACFEVPTGIFSDLIGRKKTVLYGAFFATLSAIFYALGGSFWILGVGAFCEGISRSWYSGNNEAFLHDSLNQSGNKERFAEFLGKTSAMFQLALMVSAVIGSILANWSFPLIMWLSVIPQALCFFIALFLKNPDRLTPGQSNIFSHFKISVFHLWNNRKLRLLSLQSILSYGIGESSFNFGAVFINTIWPLWAIGFSKMISYGGATLSYWFSGKIIKKFGAINILIIANIYTRIANFIAYGKPTIISPVLMASSSVFYGATEVSKKTLMQKEYTQEQRATLESTNALFGNIFYALFSPLLGLIADHYSPAIALLFVQFCMLSVLYINFKLKKMETR